jgi:spore germination cell wall hydrolase CwlJ-like protein
MMRSRQLVCALWLSTMVLPATAKEPDAATSTTAAIHDLRRLPTSTIIPAIRQQGSVKGDQILCLALAMYHEARGETEAERLAVAQVVYNRALHTDSTICATVWAENGSQFQWVKSSATIIPREQSVWEAVQGSAVRFARQRPADSTHGATNFYNPTLCSPNWANEGRVTVSFRQVFLRIDGKYSRFAAKTSPTDPISQVDQLGRLRPTRSYGSGQSRS